MLLHRGGHRLSARDRRRVLAGTIACLLLSWGMADARQEPQRQLNFYPSLQLKFVSGQAHNYFLSRTGIVNMSGKVMRNLTLQQTFPDKLHPRVINEDQADLLIGRPKGFTESIDGNTYTVHVPELRVAEATALVVVLTYKGRPADVTFKGAKVTFTLDAETHEETGPDQTWDLSKYTKYSGTLREFIKRYAKLDMMIPAAEGWGFTDLASRMNGRFPTGPVEITTTRSGRMRFSIQAGTPGTLSRILVIKRPYNPAQELKAKDEVRRLIMGMVRSSADFTLDADEMSIRKDKIGKFNGWVAETRWYDRVKDRLGEGPSRWYVFLDKKAVNQYIIALSAQGRGIGPEKIDTPNDEKEQELMSRMAQIITKIRIL